MKAVDPPAGTGRSSGSRLREAFLLHFVVVMTVLTLTITVAACTYNWYVRKPRVNMISFVYAGNLAALVSSVQALPAPMRGPHLEQLEKLSNGRVVADDPQRWGMSTPPGYLAPFFERLKQLLPGYAIGFTPGERDRLWIAVPIPGADARWVRMDLPTLVVVPTGNAVVALFVVIVAVSAGTASFIVLARRRLAWVAQALDGLDPHREAASALPPGEGHDLGYLDRHFRKIAARLSEAQGERAVLMAGVSRDLERLLKRLRDARPRTSTPAEEALCIDEMQRVIRKFGQSAQPTYTEPRHALDLNQVLAEVVAQSALAHPGISMNLDPLPYIDFRPSAARRVIGNLLDNALRYGSQVEVTASLAHGWIVVRVLDRGPGVSSAELALLGQPFYRTARAQAMGPGSGLGLAIARQDVEAHGGALRLAMRVGGGLQAEVWLRPARLPEKV